MAEAMLSPNEWKSQGEWFDYKGNKIFFNQEGKGEVLLCIHGFPTASWDWHTVWKELSGRFRMIAPDMLGFGFSDKPKGYPYSILHQADMIEQLLGDQGISSVHILAHDYGDTVAQELLSRQASTGNALAIQSICFLNGGLFPETHHPLFIQKLFMSPLGFVIGKFMSRKKLANNLRSIIGSKSELSDLFIDHLWHLIECNDGTSVAHLLIRYMKERVTFREKWVGAMQRSSVPLCIINGLDDPISGRHMVKRYRELIPNPCVYELAGTGHFPPLENAKGLLEHFNDFQNSI